MENEAQITVSNGEEKMWCKFIRCNNEEIVLLDLEDNEEFSVKWKEVNYLEFV